MNRRAARDTERVVRDGETLDRAIVAARRRVIRQHRLLGVPLAIWRDGRVVEVAPETVDLPANQVDNEPSDHEH
jgi:hypothetical protein